MPIVGQFASLARAGSFLLPGGAMESIATVTVGSGGASNVEFTNIPSGFQHLQVRAILRGTQSATSVDGCVRVGETSIDSGSNYTIHQLYGTGASATAAGYANQTETVLGPVPAASETASIFAAFVIDILDYGSTSKNKTIRQFGGTDRNGSGRIDLSSSVWRSTSALGTLRVFGLPGNLAQHSTVALYGLRAP